MKILMIGCYGGYGGAENVMRRDIMLLSEADVEISVVYGDNKMSDSFQSKVKKIFIKDLKPDFTFNGKGSKPLYDIIQRENPDIVHFHNTELFEDTQTIEEIIQTYPTVISAYNHYLSCPSKSKNKIINDKMICQRTSGLICLFCKYVFKGNATGIRSMYKRLLKVKENIRIHNISQKVIVVNEYMKNTLLRCGINNEKIEIIVPSFPDIDVIQYDGYNDRKNDILFVGRIEHVKGAQFLLEASRYIKTSHTIHIVGNGSYLSELKILADQLHLVNNVQFYGKVDDRKLSELYHHSAVMVVPSVWPETFGLVGQEAISHGLPVIAFNVGGIASSWCFDGINGFLVKPRDVRELGMKINMILENNKMASIMSQKSREIALKLFKPITHRNELLSVYNETLN